MRQEPSDAEQAREEERVEREETLIAELRRNTEALIAHRHALEAIAGLWVARGWPDESEKRDDKSDRRDA